MKKIKDSIKLEMKREIQKELVKIIAEQISKENVFVEMKQNIIDDFCEDVSNKPLNIFNETLEKNKTIDFLKKMDVIKDGKMKDFFDVMINKKIGKEYFKTNEIDISKINIPNIPEDNLWINGEIPIDGSEITKKVKRNKIYSHILNENNISEVLASLRPQENEYHLIEYTDETLDLLFNLLEESKLNLIVSCENVLGDTKFKVSNGEEKYLGESGLINSKHLSFELKIDSLSKIELENVFINGHLIERGIIELKTANEILDIVNKNYLLTKENQAEIIPNVEKLQIKVKKHKQKKTKK